jgi:hypothetical protein
MVLVFDRWWYCGNHLGAKGEKVDDMLMFFKSCHQLFLLIGMWYKGIRYRGEKPGNQNQVPSTQNPVAHYILGVIF